MQLIDEAKQLSGWLHARWNSVDSERLDVIWKELAAPYARFFTAGCLGYHVGAGWWEDLLHALAEIDAIMQKHPTYVFKVRQIKEKFGDLRFYFSVESTEEDVNRDELAVLDRAVWEIIDRAGAATATKCEICGEPGEKVSNGWVKTLCETHRKQFEKRK